MPPTFESLIPISWWQQITFAGLCLWIVLSARPEVGLAIFLSIASWTRGFLIGPISQIWLLLFTTLLAAVRLLVAGRVKPFLVPRHGRAILFWILLWWIWMTALFILFLPDSDWRSAENLYKNALLYVVFPLPVIMLLPKHPERVVSFAWAYVATSSLGGAFALNMIGARLSDLLIDPMSIARSSFALGLQNYHWFAYQYAISIIFLFCLFMYTKSLYLRLLTLFSCALCLYFLLLSSSRQSLLGIAIVLMFCLVWTMGSGTAEQRGTAVVFAALTVTAGIVLVQRVPEVLRLGLSTGGSLLPRVDDVGAILQARSDISWRLGLALLPESVIFGTGFSRYFISHNLFLGTVVDQGAIGLIFLLGYLGFWVREALRAWKTPKRSQLRIWKLAMVAIMVFVLIQSQFSGTVVSEWAMWWSLAFLWSLNGLDEAMPTRRNPTFLPNTLPASSCW